MSKVPKDITPYVVRYIKVSIIFSTILVLILDYTMKHQFNTAWLIWNVFLLYITNKKTIDD